MKSKISSLREEQQSLQKRAKGEGITDDRVRTQILQNVKNRLNAIEAVELEWNKYTGGISNIKTGVFATKKELPILKLVRDDARSQINILEVAAVMQIVKSNIEALNSAIVTIKGINLIPLTPDMVFRMLNIKSS